MKTSFLKSIPSLVSSILLIVLGILALVLPDIFATSLSWLIGTVLIGSGILLIGYAVIIRNSMFGSTWLFIEGAITIVFGILALINKDSLVKVLTWGFAIWLMFKGISQIVGCFDLYRYNAYLWWIGLVFGIIYIGFSITLFVYPKEVSDAIRIIIGIVLIVTGILKCIDLPALIKRQAKEEKVIKYMSKSVREMDDKIDIDFTKED